MTISDEISIIANKLANEGKTPSVALIKGNLSQPVALPKIIAALKTWQHDPEFTKPTHSKTSTAPSTKASTAISLNTEEVNLLISKALAPLQNEITELKQQLKALLDNSTNSRRQGKN